MTRRYSRARTLLRMAPWADVDLLRANLIKACEEIFAKWGDKTPPSYRKQFDDYLAGERATLPSAFDFQVTFVKVFRDTFSQYADDHGQELTMFYVTSEMIPGAKFMPLGRVLAGDETYKFRCYGYLTS